MNMRGERAGKAWTVSMGAGVKRTGMAALVALGLAARVAAQAAPQSEYNFAYQLSGDRRVAALQVFDDGRDTWLQFAPDQPLPALFTRVRGLQGGEHDQLAPFRQQGPYLVVAGLNTRVSMRIGHVIAHADYIGQPGRQPVLATPPRQAGGRDLTVDGSLSAGVPLVPATPHAGQAEEAPVDRSRATAQTALTPAFASAAVPLTATPLAPLRRAEPATVDAVSVLPVSHQPLASRSTADRLNVAAPASPAVSQSPATPTPRAPEAQALSAPAPGLRASVTAPPRAVPAPTTATASSSSSGLRFNAAPADHSMRQALSRWAQAAGWTFAPEHWTVPVDIPLTGSADFGGDFKAAVRDLLAATELAEQPLQPCFYSNQVLRVVPLPEACDRTAGERPGVGGAVL